MTFYSHAYSDVPPLRWCRLEVGVVCSSSFPGLTSLSKRTHYLTYNPHVHSLSAVCVFTHVIRNHVAASSDFFSLRSFKSRLLYLN